MAESRKRRAENYIVRTREQDPAEAVRIRQPLNPRSEVLLQGLSEHVGMARMHLHMARVVPGRESFVPHAHASQEEFLFILEGAGQLEVDGDLAPVGPGDYIGFPVDGAAHNLSNDGSVDLVYLMGGERTPAEVVRFPSLGKLGLWSEGVMRYIDADAGEAYSIADFIVPDEPA